MDSIVEIEGNLENGRIALGGGPTEIAALASGTAP
jgi:hypothetical protein